MSATSTKCEASTIIKGLAIEMALYAINDVLNHLAANPNKVILSHGRVNINNNIRANGGTFCNVDFDDVMIRQFGSTMVGSDALIGSIGVRFENEDSVGFWKKCHVCLRLHHEEDGRPFVGKFGPKDLKSGNYLVAYTTDKDDLIQSLQRRESTVGLLPQIPNRTNLVEV